ncbi:MAG: hypothetical protein QNJ90_05335 [Planctomycetota bacterium]|nr:hypothetical protein [Planctomycetota bacterium]
MRTTQWPSRPKTSLAVLALILLAVPTAWAGPEQTHTGVYKTEHFEIRYRPGSRAGAAVERDGARAERDLARICRQLDVANDGRYRLFLYDDSAELGAINKLTGVGAFAAGKDVHTPFGDDQTRAHEIAHVVTARLPKSGDEPRNMFFPDGISNALLEHVHGIPVHAVAKFYRMRKQLPPLAEMTGAKDFYAWLRKRPRFNGYDVAASWFRFLLDAYDVKSVKAYYTGTPPAEAFGQPLSVLEKAWHEHLDGFALRKEVELLLRKKAGEDVRFDRYALDPFLRLPADLRGKPKDWKDVTSARLKSSDKAWSREKGVLRGTTKSMHWSWSELGTKALGDGAIHVQFEPAARCVGVAVSFGQATRALLTNAGTFLYFGDHQRAGSRAEVLRGGRPVQMVLVQRDGQAQIWVDGVKVVERALEGGKGVPLLGIAGGATVVRAVRIRRL